MDKATYYRNLRRRFEDAFDTMVIVISYSEGGSAEDGRALMDAKEEIYQRWLDLVASRHQTKKEG